MDRPFVNLHQITSAREYRARIKDDTLTYASRGYARWEQPGTYPGITPYSPRFQAVKSWHVDADTELRHYEFPYQGVPACIADPAFEFVHAGHEEVGTYDDGEVRVVLLTLMECSDGYEYELYIVDDQVVMTLRVQRHPWKLTAI